MAVDYTLDNLLNIAQEVIDLMRVLSDYVAVSELSFFAASIGQLEAVVKDKPFQCMLSQPQCKRHLIGLTDQTVRILENLQKLEKIYLKDIALPPTLLSKNI